jgi:hypothetical protein
MKIKIAVIIGALLLGTLCPFQLALASDLFYTGNIVIDSVTIRVDADDDATVDVAYILTNRGSYSEQVDLQFAQSPVPLESDGGELINPVVFKPNEKKSISLTCNLDITGETTKTLSLDPTILLNGKPNSEPTKELLVKVFLPEGIRDLAWANQEPNREGVEAGRKFYLWNSVGIYPTILCLKWSTLQVELLVKKRVIPQEITSINQIISVRINLYNSGDTTVNEISLTDKYSGFEFAPVYPWWEFGGQEPWLIWRENIYSLEPGKGITLVYFMRYVGLGSQNHDFDLEPCVITVDGHLVVVSNKVRMSRSGEAMPAAVASDVLSRSETEPVHSPSLPLLGVVMLVVAVVRGGYLIWRRKH